MVKLVVISSTILLIGFIVYKIDSYKQKVKILIEI